MIHRLHVSLFVASVSLCAGCGDDGDGESGASVSTSGDSTGLGESSGAAQTTGEVDASTAADASAEASGGDSTSIGTATDADSTTDSTTGAASGFERFMLSDAAGPCPPDADCDGFVELLASGMLRIETFGDVSDEVTEVEISGEDLQAAVDVFTDPALLALLDGVDPICKPPTDIFESMTVEIDGTVHEATTTACDQAPLVAARTTAEALVAEYGP